MQKSNKRNPLSLAILASLAATSLAIAPVYAQDNSEDQTEETEQEENENLETIVVTGSRIPRPGIDTFYPVISVDSQELDDNAFTNVADALNEIPTFGNPDATPQGTQNGFSVGQNFVDFLGLGAQRTLTLVNGRRFVSQNTPSIFGESGGLQVDFNVIPLALVDRIETIGVGGAPIYGSDAIAGTINVILKDRYQGVNTTFRHGFNDEGDGEFEQYSILAGANFDNGRGNVYMSAEWFQQEGVFGTARPELTAGDNDVFYAEADGVNQIFTNSRINIFTNGGLASPTGDCPFPPSVFGESCVIPSFGIGAFPDGTFYQFDQNSNLVPFTPGAPGPGSFFFALGGDGPDFFDQVDQFQSPLERGVFTAGMNYDLTYNVRVSSDILFANSNAVELGNQGGFQTFAFGGDSGSLTFQANHPFLPQQARDVLAANGLTEFTLERFNNDIIDSRSFREQSVWRVTGGLDGNFEFLDRDWTWETYFVHGQSDAETRGEGIIDGRFLNAINVRRLTAEDLEDVSENQILALSGTSSAGVGDLVCESVYQAALGNITGVTGNGVTDDNLPFIEGCVPLNLFGEGVRSAAARDWVTGDQIGLTDLEQTVYNANLGTSLFGTPGGDVAFNIGFEARYEDALFQPSLGQQVPITRSAPFDATGGSYSTDEIYGELFVPVFNPDNDIPFVRLLEFNGAVREIDNSLAGSATVWTAGGRYSPVRDITFRGNYTEAIRAPSLTELFAPVTQSFSFADDPCDTRFVNDGPNPDVRRANCIADLGSGYDPDAFTSNIVNATAVGRTGGNPDLENEKSEAYTVGVTIEPRWVDNLLFTADYINVELNDAITSLGLTDLMEACYDSTNFPAGSACGSFERNDAGQVVDFLTGQTNAQQFRVEVLDFSGRYRFNVADATGLWTDSYADSDLGQLSILARLSKTIDRVTSVQGEAASNTVGGFTDPEWSGTFDFTYTRKDLRVFWRTAWQDEADLSPSGDNLFVDEDGNPVTKTSHRFIHDLSVAYYFGELFPGAPQTTTVQLGINNVFDRSINTVEQAAGHYGFDEIFGRQYTISIRGEW